MKSRLIMLRALCLFMVFAVYCEALQQPVKPSTKPITNLKPDYPHQIVETHIMAPDIDQPPLSTTTQESKCPISNGPLSGFYFGMKNMIETVNHDVEERYTEISKQWKCPFLRRRVTDHLDQVTSILASFFNMHEILPFLPNFEVPGQKSMNGPKTKNLSVEEISNILRSDWRLEQATGKGYYITGRLTSQIYRDDCVFDGPDPDMPVKGLRKYQSAASHLFDRKVSRADVLDMTVDEKERTVQVAWRLSGILNLPWHPTMKPFTGTTTYYLDEDNLVALHEESWDITATEAFVGVLFPWLDGEETLYGLENLMRDTFVHKKPEDIPLEAYLEDLTEKHSFVDRFIVDHKKNWGYYWGDREGVSAEALAEGMNVDEAAVDPFEDSLEKFLDRFIVAPTVAAPKKRAIRKKAEPNQEI